MTMTNTKSQENHIDRIASLEAGQKATGREISALREEFGQFAIDVRRTLQDIGVEHRREMAALQASQVERARTQWGPILSAASLTVAVLGGLIALGSNGPLNDVRRHDGELNEMRHNRFTVDDGEALQREMHREVDAVLQRVIEHTADGHRERLDERVQALTERVRTIEAARATRQQ